jgi:hypothetical protein
LLVNGQLDDDAAERIRELGGKVVEHVWVEPVTEETWFERASNEEKRERLAADLMLGRMPNAEGVTRTERDIQASMAKALAPMRKSTHVAGMKKAPRRNW